MPEKKEKDGSRDITGARDYESENVQVYVEMSSEDLKKCVMDGEHDLLHKQKQWVLDEIMKLDAFEMR
jgi:hypothetical protein